jgi:hypothetical protein
VRTTHSAQLTAVKFNVQIVLKLAFMRLQIKIFRGYTPGPRLTGDEEEEGEWGEVIRKGGQKEGQGKARREEERGRMKRRGRKKRNEGKGRVGVI